MRASSHVRYEMDMLLAAACLLGKAEGRPDSVGYAFLESFLVHARNLIEFFYFDELNKGHLEDLRAFEYAPDWKTTDAKGIADALYWRHHAEISMRTSHLSAARAKTRPEKWDCDSIRKNLCTLWRIFVRALPEDHGSLKEFSLVLKEVTPLNPEGYGTAAVDVVTVVGVLHPSSKDPFGESECELA